jgi:hypothetical protein
MYCLLCFLSRQFLMKTCIDIFGYPVFLVCRCNMFANFPLFSSSDGTVHLYVEYPVFLACCWRMSANFPVLSFSNGNMHLYCRIHVLLELAKFCLGWDISFGPVPRGW